MEKEIISDKQGISLLVLYITSDAFLFATASDVKQDFWIAIIFALLIATLMTTIFIRINHYFPKKDLFDVNEYIFGSIVGKTLTILYTMYVFQVAISVLRTFSEFINVVSFNETPKEIFGLSIIILCILVVKGGIELIGRVAEIFIIIIVSIAILGFFLLIPQMDMQNLLPVFSSSFTDILKSGYSTFSFLFGETVVFMMIFSSLKAKNSSLNIYFKGLIIGGLITLISSLVGFTVLGANTYSTQYFPGYQAAARLNVGSFLQRIEVIVSIAYILGGFVKISMCLLIICKGIKKVFKYCNYRALVTPMALLVVNFSIIIYEDIMHMFEWANIIWPIYVLPFQIILPLTTVITAKLKYFNESKHNISKL